MTEFWYNMIIDRGQLKILGVYLMFSNKTVEFDKGLYRRCTSPMFGWHDYDFYPLNGRIFAHSEE